MRTANMSRAMRSPFLIPASKRPYDPRIRPGMTKGEVDALLPDIFPTVRTWVAQVNSAKSENSRDGLNVDEPNRAASSTASAVYSEYTEPQQRR